MNAYRYFDTVNDTVDTSSGAFEVFQSKTINYKSQNSFVAKLDLIRNDIIGNYSKYISPFSCKPICYVDWTASGKSVKSIESYILTNVMKNYGNTHTSTSITGKYNLNHR